jgi:GalNAc-alpha-(1->4)-GalNAc-alpha-(1->3)-diNAcBac-PP-undecaprenol alpha-1,4-N-acetyl-D-galactosaminyltransferase
MSKKVICLVIPSLQAGGMERVMSELAWYFSKKEEVELHIVLYGITREIFFTPPDNARLHRPTFKFRNSFRLYYTLKTLAYLRKTLSRIRPDSILSFGEYWNNFVLLSMLFKKTPIYVSDRSQPNKSLGRFQDKLRQWLYPGSTGVILQSTKAKQIYQEKMSRLNIRVIGNPIREIKIQSEGKRENNILMVGRLIKTKHQDSLIRIFASLKNKEWNLVIVGYDHLKQSNMKSLKALAKELGVSERVIFAGKQSNVDEYYLKSGIFAFTSSSEGFPNAIGEAMSAGLPVVAYDCDAGPSEMIIDGQTGFLIPLFDDEAFRAKLELLIENPDQRSQLGNAGKEQIKKFNIESIGNQFYDFITDNRKKN